MKIRVPLLIKIMVPLIALIIITVGISGYRVYRESTGRWRTEMDVRLERVAALVARTVDSDQLQSIREPVDIDTPAYSAVAQQLEQAMTAGNLNWVGIYYREGDYFYYWVDTDFTGVGYPFFFATPAHLAAYETQQPQPVQYTDEFGSYYGFVAPIVRTNKNGSAEVLGLVEALVYIEARDLLQRDTLNRVLGILIGGSVIAVGLSLVINLVLFNRPLRTLQRGALALAEGKFGYTINLPTRDEWGDLAATFNQMSDQLERLYQERAEQERVQRELEIARNVQQALFPAQIPTVTGLEIAAFCRPHRETSGDFYDLLELGAGQIGVVVGDVSGKSIPAAMLMVAAQSIIRAEAYNHSSPARVLNESNTILHHNIPRGMFAAVSYARFDARSGELVWANAGQIYPFLLHRVRPDNLQEYPRYLETRGVALPLGMHTAHLYKDHQLKLLSGDTVLFYTDGVIEAMNEERSLYGFERLESLVRTLDEDLTPQALIEAVLASVATFVGPAEQHDDITLVAIKVRDESF